MKTWSNKLTTIGLTIFLISCSNAYALPKPIQSLTDRGAKVIESSDAPDGMTHYVLAYRGNFLNAYVTPDNQHVLVGTLISSDANNIPGNTDSGRETAQSENVASNGNKETDARLCFYEHEERFENLYAERIVWSRYSNNQQYINVTINAETASGEEVEIDIDCWIDSYGYPHKD